jgi:hypothetical protein
MDLRTFLFERRIKGVHIIKAGKRHKLTNCDVSRVINRSERHYPPSERVRSGIWSALIKLGYMPSELSTIEDLKAE